MNQGGFAPASSRAKLQMVSSVQSPQVTQAPAVPDAPSSLASVNTTVSAEVAKHWQRPKGCQALPKDNPSIVCKQTGSVERPRA